MNQWHWTIIILLVVIGFLVVVVEKIERDNTSTEVAECHQRLLNVAPALSSRSIVYVCRRN